MENRSLKEFTELLASPAPVPGGGGACAAVSSMGIALGDMVGEFTVGKKKYAQVEAEIREYMAKSQQLRQELLLCIDQDAANFEPLSKAYGIPKDDPSRDAVMEQCLKDAASVPLKIFDLTMQAIDLLDEFAHKGSRLMISDAATGAAFCRGALQGAAVNVKVNTKLMKDRAYAEELNAYIDSHFTVYSEKAQAVFDLVYQEL
ncbi:MAG: cyclodeaminase/cyclohydrolase family protein [Firmicutes bacterium]|nr:cyclodeaminase/cyclohydrolase family protein [Bacillota bacterium]